MLALLYILEIIRSQMQSIMRSKNKKRTSFTLFILMKMKKKIFEYFIGRIRDLVPGTS